MRKVEELSTPTSTLNKASDDEPLFILRAQDRLAPDTVRHWAERLLAEATRERDPERALSMKAKFQEAMACARTMELWADATGKRKIPD